MDKRATRQATLYSILFLVMLFFAGITFFLGLKVGIDKTEEKYAHLLIDPTEADNYQYQQQDLVTFYLTTYSAYEKFHMQWFDSIHDIQSKRVSNPANVFDELATLADKQLKEAKSTSMLGQGLLDNAQQSYIRSLEYFKKAASSLDTSLDKKTADEAISIINNDNNYTLAVEHALKAQQQYFTAMHKWTTSVDQNITANIDYTITRSIDTWSQEPLIVKLNIISHYLENNSIYKPALPQDIVSRIDEFIAKEQATQLNLNTVLDVMELLFVTDAIRFGDFDEYKGTRYENEFLPKIPFIYVN